VLEFLGRGENLREKIRNPIAAFGRFNERHSAMTDGPDALVRHSSHLMSGKIPGAR
jgi:hypothetical protein